MKRIYVILTCLLCASYIQAQTEFNLYLDNKGQIKALPKQKQYELTIPEFDYNSYQPSTTTKLDFLMMKIDMNYMQTSMDERPMNMQIRSAAYRPFYNAYTPMLRRVSPMAFDFYELTTVPLSEKVSFLVSGSQSTWPGMGAMHTVSANLALQQGDFTFIAGTMAGRYFTPFNPHPGFLSASYLQVMYDPTERLRLRAWGQYAYYYAEENPFNSSLKEKDNPHMLLNPFMPHTSVGGAMEFKFTNNFGIGVGVNYEYNNWQRRLERQVLLYPVFNTGRFKIGIQ